MRHPWRECDIPDFLLPSEARCARNLARLRLAGCSIPHVTEFFFSSGYLKRFFIVSILIAGLASKQGSINFGQKKRYRNRTSSLLAMCLYLGEAEQLPPPKPPFLCLQFCLCSCFYFCPTVSFMLPLKTLPQKKNVPQKMFFAPIFFGVPDSSCDIMSHKATLGATSSSKMRPHVAMRH
jgi:hypothetical protein